VRGGDPTVRERERLGMAGPTLDGVWHEVTSKQAATAPSSARNEIQRSRLIISENPDSDDFLKEAIRKGRP
jgi:hypothetical protein